MLLFARETFEKDRRKSLGRRAGISICREESSEKTGIGCYTRFGGFVLGVGLDTPCYAARACAWGLLGVCVCVCVS